MKNTAAASTALTLGAAALLWAAAAGDAGARPQIMIRGLVAAGEGSAPPSFAFCEAAFKAACYSPQDLRTAYGLNRLIEAGFDGAGQTIVIIDSYGSPTIEADLKAFDAGYDLPDPPSLTVLAPFGSVPWDPKKYPGQPGWGGEVTLDVEWAHAMAPGASIVLLTSPVNETQGVQGLPEFLKLEKYAVDHHLGKIISQSWTATENTLLPDAAGPAGPRIVAEFSAFYAHAAEEDVTVFCAAGDSGSSNVDDAGAYYPFPTVGFPASSPLVTAVGGTDLQATSSGVWQTEQVWNDAGCCAGGGGVSQLFAEPAYQSALPAAVQTQLGGKRGLPDVSYNAAVGNEFIFIYASYPGSGGAGWYGIGGTSEGSPQWAGVAADLNQYAGRPLGFLNPTLYAVGAAGLLAGVTHDIAIGDNALTGVKGATAPGYAATKGWDLATGWGTPNLADLPAFWPGLLSASRSAGAAQAAAR